MKSPKNHTTIQIELTNACIHNCSNCTRFCGHHKNTFFMDFETFKRAVDSLEDFDGTIGIMGGEPTLHPEFERFVSYLGEHLPEEKQKKENPFIHPQKDFMSAMHDQEWENFSIRDDCGKAMGIINGAGLWSAMGKAYKRNYELIQDVFKRQVLNDHNNTMLHQPILISRKDLGIDDETWMKLRENCWINQMWSASITPKGCFFCEVAAAMDMLFDGPGGWPIEKGWWKREGKELEEQTHWCEYCGIPLMTFTRDANEEVDDVSPTLLEMLKKVESPKLGTRHVNVLKIEDGEIAEESKKSFFARQEEKFAAFYEARFNKARSVLFPEKLVGVRVDNTGGDSARNKFDESHVLTSGSRFGVELERILRGYTWEEYIVLYTDNIRFREDFMDELKSMVLNPGTLLWLDLKENGGKENRYVKNAASLNAGFVAVLNKSASSLVKFGRDRLLGISGIQDIVDMWDTSKIVCLSEEMIPVTPETVISADKRYALFGTGYWIEEYLKDHDVNLMCVVDSSEKKQGQDFHGVLIEAPDVLLSKRNDFDKVLIGSKAYYPEIKETLLNMGFCVDDLALI